jgi:hypothetical protein
MAGPIGRQATGRQAVLSLKKKNQKNFSHLAPVASQTRRRRGKRSAIHRFHLATNTPYGLKLPSPAANRSQMEKSFFGSFFSKKEPLAFLPLAFLNPSLP